MTERLYYTDAYLLEFDAQVVDAGIDRDRPFVVLDRSAFYPTSGGQLHDIGSINDVHVIDVTVDDDGVVRHFLEQGLEVGVKVRGTVDKTRRRHYRQHHTAQHILSSVLAREFDAMTESVHLGLEYCGIETDRSKYTDDDLKKLEGFANEVIAQAIPINALMLSYEEALKYPLRRKPPEKEKLRLIQIGDFEVTACGGTHCRSTAEVRVIKIIGAEKIRKRLQIKFIAGELALQDYVERYRVTDTLSRRLTCHPADLPEKWEKQEEVISTLKGQLMEAQKKLIPVLVDDLISRKFPVSGDVHAICEVVDVDAGMLQDLATATAEAAAGPVMLLAGERMLLATVSHHAGKLARGIVEKCGVKGGGGPTLAQFGKVNAENLPVYKQCLVELLSEA